MTKQRLAIKVEKRGNLTRMCLTKSYFMLVSLPDMSKSDLPTVVACEGDRKAAFYRLNEDWLGGHRGDGLAIVFEKDRMVSIFIEAQSRGEE